MEAVVDQIKHDIDFTYQRSRLLCTVLKFLKGSVPCIKTGDFCAVAKVNLNTCLEFHGLKKDPLCEDFPVGVDFYNLSHDLENGSYKLVLEVPNFKQDSKVNLTGYIFTFTRDGKIEKYEYAPSRTMSVM